MKKDLVLTQPVVTLLSSTKWSISQPTSWSDNTSNRILLGANVYLPLRERNLSIWLLKFEMSLMRLNFLQPISISRL